MNAAELAGSAGKPGINFPYGPIDAYNTHLFQM